MNVMKLKSNFKRVLPTPLIAFFFMTFSLQSTAQELASNELKEFQITIERTEDGLKMLSSKGSAWINLSFSLVNNKPQAIDEYGMTKLGDVSSNKDPELADYLFTITKTKDGILLKGIEGTAWKELSFSLRQNDKQVINQFGMTD